MWLIPAVDTAPRSNSDSNHSSISSGIIIGATRIKSTSPRVPCFFIGFSIDRKDKASFNPKSGSFGGVNSYSFSKKRDRLSM